MWSSCKYSRCYTESSIKQRKLKAKYPFSISKFKINHNVYLPFKIISIYNMDNLAKAFGNKMALAKLEVFLLHTS